MKVVVMGAGPAGLTAAHELVHRFGAEVTVVEQQSIVGGISSTVQHNGNRIDIGGHRFFSKSDRVMNWWLDRMPLEKTSEAKLDFAYQGKTRDFVTPADGPDPHETDNVMLIRERQSRIYWGRRMFDYPLSMSPDTLGNLGVGKAAKAGTSYLKSMAFPLDQEVTLEDFFINRFGRELYETFFKSYTEKVWGVPCAEITAEWGAQRIKGLDLKAALLNAVTPSSKDVSQKDTETSLIERFLYPKYGPGQMWERVTSEIEDAGGTVLMEHRVVGLESQPNRISSVEIEDRRTGKRHHLAADAVVSTLPLPFLVDALAPHASRGVRDIASGLPFRDFFTVGLLVDQIELEPAPGQELVKDNWIYIQEEDVQIGRLQIFNNWSPWMVADPSKVWLGLEYFCQHTDPIWKMADADLMKLGEAELIKIGILRPGVVLDGCVLRVRRTYPAYFGTYHRLGEVTSFLDGFENLWCVGRNGQHRYNNQDHSMLTAMMAAEAIAGLDVPRSDIWAVNTEDEYHEASK